MPMKPAMTRFFSGMQFLLSSIGLFGAFSCNGYAQNAGQPASKPRHPDKLTLTECEDGDNCGTGTYWWASRKGNGAWRNGEEAQLEIEVLEKDKVVIRRFNTKGANEGLT